MHGSRRSLLNLPPEVLLEISTYLRREDLCSVKSAYPILDNTLTFSPRTMAATSLPLLSLPPELIYEIADHLPPDAILALKLTHPKLNETLDLANRTKGAKFSSCARLAIRTYLSKRVLKPSHMRCILCKAVYPVALFSSSSSPACVPLSFVDDDPQLDVIELPQRFCAWHVGRLAKIIHTEKDGRNEWVSSIREMCMHCGTVKGWGDCKCNCDSCGSRRVRTYTRYLNNKIECKRFLFWRDASTSMTENLAGQEQLEGQLCVRETCWDPGKRMCSDASG